MGWNGAEHDAMGWNRMGWGWMGYRMENLLKRNGTGWNGMDWNGTKRNGRDGFGLKRQGSRSLLKIGSWTLSNLCDGQPRPMLDVHTVVPALAKLLQHGDSEILRSCSTNFFVSAVFFWSPFKMRVNVLPAYGMSVVPLYLPLW